MLRAESHARLRVIKLKKVHRMKADVEKTTTASVDEKRKAV